MNTVTIVEDPLPTVTAPTVSNQCTASSGFTFTVSATGVAPLSYSINGGASYQTSPTFTVNAAGSYTIMVKDGNGCTATSSTTTDVFAPITTSALLTKDLTCSAPSDATIDVTVSGGNAPYSYKVKVNGGAYGSSNAFAGTTFTYSTSTAGTYQFEITDANGCTKETNIITTNATIPVTISTASVDPTCNGSTDGSIKLTPLTGESPFTYSIDGGSTFVYSNVFGGLVTGNYDYVVRDSKGCEVSGIINLSDPLPIDVTIVRNAIQCNANVPGSLDVTINSGGIAPFTYSLFDNTYTQVGASVTTVSTTHTFSGLSFGDYYVAIVDSNGCEYRSTDQRIETPPNIQLDAVTSTGSCATGATVDITVITGVSPFTYSIYGQPTTSVGPTASTTHTFTGLDHGVTYFFQVQDAGGCFSIIEVTTPVLSAIAIDPITTTDVTCNGADNGTVSFTISDYNGSVTSLYYEVRDELTNVAIIPAQNGTFNGLTGAPVNGSITGLAAGNYKLFVREADGTLCTVSKSFKITQPIQPLLSAISDEVNANCNSGAQITITATGGTGPYQYAAGAPGFTPVAGDFSSNNVLNLDPSIRTNWDIVVEDANGCSVTLNKTISSDPDPTIDPVAQQCFDGTPISITLVEGTGTAIAPLTYSIGGAYQTSPNFTISAAGTYNVSIKDGNGCIATTTYIVEPPLLLDADLTQDLTCTVDANITLTASGGTGTYTTYEVNYNGGGYAVIAGSPYTATVDGTYQFRVTDSQGCTAESNIITVTPKTTPTFT